MNIAPSARSPIQLLCFALAATFASTIAEPLPSELVLTLPVNGTARNSTGGISTYTYDGTADVGEYLRIVNFTSLTYPNGTSSPAGAVSSNGCKTLGATYTFGFDNTQAGDYVLEVLVSVAAPENGVCPGPEGYQNSTLTFGWTLEDLESNTTETRGTTTTATLAEAPTGTYVPAEKPASGASRTAGGAALALLLGASAMGLLV